jgi:type IV secretory pathway TrbF-like protein
VSSIEWRDPPDTRGGGRKQWRELLAPLIERPNAWAMVRAYSTPHQAAQTVWQLRNGRMTRPAGQWEFAARRGEVFARYLGEES